MQVNRLLSSILTGPWLIEGTTAAAHLPLLERFLSGQAIDLSEQQMESPVCAVAFAGGQVARYESYDEAPEGSVAIINLSGVMMRQDSCFSYGTESLARMTQEAYGHPNISALVKVISSGGGQVNGTEHYASVLGASPKPVVTYVKGMMASAAYWVGSRSQHIMLEGQTTEIGSIGTQLTLQDRTAQLASQGIKLHIIRATGSPDKNEATLKALNGDYAAIREEELDPINSVFQAAVRAARPDVSDDAITGRMYVGQAAIDAGLADSFGTLQDAINMALELAAPSNANNLKTDMSLFGSKKFAALAALAAVESISAVQLTAANEELEKEGITGAKLISEADYTSLKTKADEADGLQVQITQLVSDKQVQENTIAGLNKDLEAANAKAAQFGSQPGAAPTTPIAAGSELSEEGAASPDRTIAALEHNRVLENDPRFN